MDNGVAELVVFRPDGQTAIGPRSIHVSPQQHAEQRLVAEAARDQCLAVKTRQGVGVGREFASHDLDRHALLDRDAGALVGRPHPCRPRRGACRSDTTRRAPPRPRLLLPASRRSRAVSFTDGRDRQQKKVNRSRGRAPEQQVGMEVYVVPACSINRFSQRPAEPVPVSIVCAPSSDSLPRRFICLNVQTGLIITIGAKPKCI